MWIKIYKTAKPYNLKYIKMKSPLRIIAEVLVPKTYEEEETLKKNLKYYKSRGYDSALLSFDTSETLHSLTRTSEIIRNSGLNVWITFSGPEDLGHSVFVDPVKLESYLITLGSYAEGFILGWRRTSLHLLLQDWQFSDFLMKSVRMGNENIVILGESYIGETAETPEHTRITTYNNPKNISGTVISGLGFHGVNVKGALNGIFSPVKNMDRIALIVGSNPYYMTLEKAKYTKKEQDTIKAALEKRFINAGCIGTITLHGDGGTVFVNGEKRITDNLCLNFGE